MIKIHITGVCGDKKSGFKKSGLGHDGKDDTRTFLENQFKTKIGNVHETLIKYKLANHNFVLECIFLKDFG